MAIDPSSRLTRARRYFERDIWRVPAPEGRLAAILRSALQLLVVVGEGFHRDHLMLRASALTYFAMLSLIPILAVAIGLLSAFGVSEDLARVVIDRVAVGSPEAGDYILRLVQRVNFGSLGAVGGATLLVTTVLGLSNVEAAFNAIWSIERQRAPMRRFADYLAVLIVAPLLFTVALSLATSFRSESLVTRLLEHPALAPFYHFGIRQMPTLLLWLGFSFLYWFLPNTNVRIPAALLGGAVAAVIFSLAQIVYIGFNVGVARANALFGSFAALPLLLVWLYVSWVVVLLGCEVAFATHSLGRLRLARAGDDPRPAVREAIGVAVAARVARAFRDGDVVTADQIASEVDIPVRAVRDVLADLEAGGIIAPRGDDERDVYQLGRAADCIPVEQVLEALRGTATLPAGEVPPSYAPVHDLMAEVEHGIATALGAVTLADLASKLDAPGAGAPERREG